MPSSPDVGAMPIPDFRRWAGNMSNAKFYREVKAGKIAVHKIGRKSVVLTPNALAYLNSLPEAPNQEAA